MENTIEHTIEHTIRTALHGAFKTLEKKTYDTERDDFLDVLLEDVMDILFPKQTKVAEAKLPTVDDLVDSMTKMKIEEEKKPEPVEEKKPEPEKKEKKKPGPKPKAKKEEKPAEPVEEKKPEPVEEKKEEEKKPVKQRVKPGPKPKPKPEGPVNVEKLTPTQTKKIKAIAEKAKVEFDKNAVLAYMNKLTKEEFDAKKLEQHAEAYYAAPAPEPVEEEPVKEDEKKEEPAEEKKEVAMIVVPFEGKEYFVNPDTKRVYNQEFDTDGNPTVSESVGYVGMAAFKDMTAIYEEILAEDN